MTAHALTDSGTMLRRQLLRMRRYPSLTVMLIGIPVVFLLLFVYVFGATLGDGLPGASGSGDGRSAYIGFVMPGILLMAVAAVAQGTAVSVSMDATEGIVARFRTMDIARSSVLTGHVLGAMVQSAITVAVVIAVGLLIGYRPEAGVGGWLGALGLLAAMSLAVTWLCIGIGLACDSVEAASNAPLPLTLLPLMGSGFVPTDSMPDGLRWFAEYQPFTPVIDGVRGFLGSGAATSDVLWALGWSVVIAALSFAWSVRLFTRPGR